MCQVVAYRGLKTIENSKTVSQKSGRGRSQEVVIYQRFQYEALTQNNLVFWEGGPLWEVVAYRRWLHVEVSTVDTIQRSKKLWRVLAIDLFSLYVLPNSDHMMFSREFPFCIFINYAYICTSMLCTRQHLKETVAWGTIMWSGKTKHAR